MARTAATLGEEARITDYISLGVITSAFPEKAIRSVLTRSGKGSVRERELPAQVMMYYVIAQALFMQVSQREVFLPGHHFNYDGEPFFMDEIWPRMSCCERLRHVTG